VIRTNSEVLMDKSSLDSETGLWSIAIQNGSTKASDITTIKARFVINAAGIDCDKVQSLAASVGSRGESTVPAPDFEARPGRGQNIIYSVSEDATNSEMNAYTPTRPIQPVLTDRTKGIFVYSTLYHLR
jgi:hypothetical protein